MKKTAYYVITSVLIFAVTFITCRDINNLLLFHTQDYYSLLKPFLLYACCYAATFVFFIKNSALRILIAALLLAAMGIIHGAGFFICAPSILFLLSGTELQSTAPEKKEKAASGQSGRISVILLACSVAVCFGGYILFLVKGLHAWFGIWNLSDFLPLVLVFSVLAFTHPASAPNQKKTKNKSLEYKSAEAFFASKNYRTFCNYYVLVMIVQSFLCITAFNSLKILFWQWIYFFLLVSFSVSAAEAPRFRSPKTRKIAEGIRSLFF